MKNIKTNSNDELPDDKVEISIEHQQIVLERMAKAEANPKRLLDWDEVSKNL